MKLNSTPNSTPNPTPNPTPNSNSNSNHKIKDININSPIFIKNSHGTHHPYSYLHDSDNVVDHNNLPIWHHPWIRRYPKTITAAMGLTFIGFIFLWVGVATLSFQPLQAMAYFITSLVTLGPGSYVCFYLFQAMKGHPDYPIASIPSFDD